MFIRMKRKIEKSRKWCEKIRPTIVRYKLFSLVAFGGLSGTSFVKDLNHQVAVSAWSANVDYMQKKTDYLDARVDSCQLSKRKAESAFKRTIENFVKQQKKD